MSYRDIAKSQLRIDEGVRGKPYRDTVGKLTIGVGRNLDDVGLSPDEIDYLLDNDVTNAEIVARILFPSFNSLSDNRRAAIINMALNLGQERLAGFHDMRAAVERQDWAGAATAMLDSRWAGQVGKRADRLAQMIKEG
ncbi:MAG TPA: glycoside hydrolase family protein [Burkholderiales bacterium]|nr:glycoside hydrolase family protein [Burkholderiales bacterium]